MTKNTSEITTIFLSKAMYGMTETSNIVLSQGSDSLHNEVNEDALRAEYEQYAREQGININYESEDN